VFVIYGAVEKVEDVGRNDRRKSHEAPVLTQSMDAKGFGDEGGEDAEEETIPHAGEARDKAKKVRVSDAQS